MKEVSILIVHYNTPGLLRQTLKGIYKSAPTISYEIIVVDNNLDNSLLHKIKKEFPDVLYVFNEENVGFGCGMNLAIKKSNSKYCFIFNPDIAMLSGVLEKLVEFMDNNTDIGIVGPKLLNPDRTTQYSCYRFMQPSMIFYRRIPILQNLSFAKKSVDNYLMKDYNHIETKDVDYLLGAALFVRRKALDEVGGFDPNFFVYFEDQDLCRRFWDKKWRVTYYPKVELIHYHRRETAEGGFIKQLFNPLTRVQIKSAMYYYRKYKGKKKPR